MSGFVEYLVNDTLRSTSGVLRSAVAENVGPAPFAAAFVVLAVASAYLCFDRGRDYPRYFPIELSFLTLKGSAGSKVFKLATLACIVAWIADEVVRYRYRAPGWEGSDATMRRISGFVLFSSLAGIACTYVGGTSGRSHVACVFIYFSLGTALGATSHVAFRAWSVAAAWALVAIYAGIKFVCVAYFESAMVGYPDHFLAHRMTSDSLGPFEIPVREDYGGIELYCEDVVSRDIHHPSVSPIRKKMRRILHITMHGQWNDRRTGACFRACGAIQWLLLCLITVPLDELFYSRLSSLYP